MMKDALYTFEECLEDGRLVEHLKDTTRYDIRKMAEEVKRLGRSLTGEEAQKYVVNRRDL